MSLENNKRIAKNTLLLYFRMFVVMFVSLFTSRIVLNALGVIDYGIYNLVGGIVAFFSIISGAVSSSISRFITFELGIGDKYKIQKVFSTSVITMLLLSFIFIILAESIGLWFINSYLEIKTDRIFAANIVYQLSILTFVVNLLSIPYNALIIAHEKMKIFANIGIFEVLCKVIIAFIVMYSTRDVLILYSILIFILSLIVRLIYGYYCKKNFDESKLIYCFDKKLTTKMFSFAGWNTIGASAGVLCSQGSNILINIFFGLTLNAARAISLQVENALNQFVTNLMTAIEPQIIKSYAANNKNYTYELINNGAKYSFFLIMILSIPIFFETNYILQLWLNIVPEYTPIFIKISLITLLIQTYSSTLMIAIVAGGDIKIYQLIVGGIQLLNFPISLIILYLGYNAISIYIVYLILTCISLIARLYILKKKINLPILNFYNTIKKTLLILSLSIIVPFLITNYMDESIYRLITTTLSSILISIICIYLLGLNKTEKQLVIDKISKLKK